MRECKVVRKKDWVLRRRVRAGRGGGRGGERARGGRKSGTGGGVAEDESRPWWAIYVIKRKGEQRKKCVGPDHIVARVFSQGHEKFTVVTQPISST